ncbi:hypothetical protein FBUS_08278 [Fasciolopsis buskii]|uniref:Uncharacterized protein n=1 Tax=Fasciolopsis buskii TaxID=27845 RepID=A0A8E0RSM7_9TREM|nr:hypothetical protein FBUS_08278 [Fasciolopsis buski]
MTSPLGNNTKYARTSASSFVAHSPASDSPYTATFSYLPDDGSENQITTAECGILSCLWMKRYKCNPCRCFRSKLEKVNRAEIPFTLPDERWCTASTNQSSSRLSHAAGDMATTNVTDFLNQESSEHSFEFTHSSFPTTLNEAFRQFIRIFQKTALPSVSDQTVSQHDSTKCAIDEPEKDCRTFTRLDSFQNEQVGTKPTVSTPVPPSTEVASKGASTSITKNETKTSVDLVTNLITERIRQIGGAFHTPITCCTLLNPKPSLKTGCIESPTLLSSSTDSAAKVISSSCKERFRRSHSLNSISQVRKIHWREVQFGLDKAYSVSSFNSSSDKAMVHGTTKDSVTASEEEIAELLGDALKEFLGQSSQKNLRNGETSCFTGTDTEKLPSETGRNISVQCKSTASYRTCSVQSDTTDTAFSLQSTCHRQQPKTEEKCDKYVQSEQCDNYCQTPTFSNDAYRRVELHRKNMTSSSSWDHKTTNGPVSREHNTRLPPVCGDIYGGKQPLRRPYRSIAIKKNWNKNTAKSLLSPIRSMTNPAIPNNSAVHQALPTAFLQAQNANERSLKLRKSSKSTSYSEQFRLRRHLASRGKQKKSWLRFTADNSYAKYSIGTARITALAKTSDFPEQCSMDSVEKELRQFCLTPSSLTTANTTDGKPQNHYVTPKCSKDVAMVSKTSNSEVVPVTHPYHQMPEISADHLWLSVRPNSTMITPNNPIVVDYRFQDPYLKPTAFFMQSAFPWAVCMPTGWSNTFDPHTQIQFSGKVFPNRYPPPPPESKQISNYLQLAAYPPDVYFTQRPTGTPNPDHSLGRTTLRVS